MYKTDPRVWERRTQILEKRFSRTWSALRNDMAIATAEPKQRSDQDVHEAFERFKLIYKEACNRHFGKQKRGPMQVFMRDIFGNQHGLLEYLRSGGSLW